MKGRILDPKLGRFLTTDPIVSAPLFGQSYNPYSYVLNNPLKYVDPSGFGEDEPGGGTPAGVPGLSTPRQPPQGEASAATGVAGAPAVRSDVALSGGRSGGLVKNLVGPPNSVVRGGGARAFVTNEEGKAILDITADRVKPVMPGQGFGPKRAPTPEELDLLDKVLKGGQ